MDMIQQLILGLALASAAGLRAFLPLLALSGASRLGIVHLNGHLSWMGSPAALTILTVATAAELLSDKIPLLNHALDLLHAVARPAAGMLVVAGTQTHLPPETAAVVGLIAGAPLAGGLHLARSGARIATTVGTAGMVSPAHSIGEDVLATATTLLAFAAPVIALLLIFGVIVAGWCLWAETKKSQKTKTAPIKIKRREG